MLCGIDEAGRGAWAGPIVIAGVILYNQIDGLDDSKKLSPAKREELFEKIVKNSQFEIVFISNIDVDKFGISHTLRVAIKEIMSKIETDEYLFDGNSSLGISNLKHLIKADSQIKEVSASSILAKVARDRYMSEIDKDYLEYGFKTHKGYGTKEHLKAIEKFGYSNLHRVSYKIKKLQPTLFE